jgi:hypothetical protein
VQVRKGAVAFLCSIDFHGLSSRGIATNFAAL